MSIYQFSCIAPLALSFFVGGIAYVWFNGWQ